MVSGPIDFHNMNKKTYVTLDHKTSHKGPFLRFGLLG